MGKIVLQLSVLFAITSPAMASGPVCLDLFSESQISSTVSTWVEKINARLEAKGLTAKDVGPFYQADLNIEKLAFLETQKIYLDALLKDGLITFDELAFIKPVLVKNEDRPQDKYYLTVFSQQSYLFHLNGKQPPEIFAAKQSFGYLAEKAITRLDSEGFNIIATLEGLKLYPKKTNPTPNTTLEADGSYTFHNMRMPALFEKVSTDHTRLAVERSFSTEIRNLIESKLTAGYELRNIKVIQSLYSDAVFIAIPNKLKTDYFTISLSDGSTSTLSELSITVHGRSYATANGEQIKLVDGIGFIVPKRPQISFNSSTLQAITVIKVQAEFILERKLTAEEIKLLDTTINYAVQVGMDMNNLNQLKVFLAGYNKIGSYTLGSIAIQAVKNLQSNYKSYH